MISIPVSRTGVTRFAPQANSVRFDDMGRISIVPTSDRTSLAIEYAARRINQQFQRRKLRRDAEVRRRGVASGQQIRGVDLDVAMDGLNRRAFETQHFSAVGQIAHALRLQAAADGLRVVLEVDGVTAEFRCSARAPGSRPSSAMARR